MHGVSSNQLGVLLAAFCKRCHTLCKTVAAKLIVIKPELDVVNLSSTDEGRVRRPFTPPRAAPLRLQKRRRHGKKVRAVSVLPLD